MNVAVEYQGKFTRRNRRHRDRSVANAVIVHNAWSEIKRTDYRRLSIGAFVAMFERIIVQNHHGTEAKRGFAQQCLNEPCPSPARAEHHDRNSPPVATAQSGPRGVSDYHNQQDAAERGANEYKP